MEINNTGSTYGAAFRQKPIFFMSGKETVAFFEGKLKKNMTLQEDSCTLGSNDTYRRQHTTYEVSDKKKGSTFLDLDFLIKDETSSLKGNLSDKKDVDSLLSKAMGDEKTKQWLEYNLSLIPKTIEQSRAYVAARGAKILSYSITINGYDSMSSVMCTQDEVDPGTEKARKELEERLEKKKAEKKETEERLEKQRAEKQEQEERQYNLKIDGKDVDDLTGKMVELLGTSTSIGVTENGVSAFDALA